MKNNNKIPKHPKQKRVSKDTRPKYLDEWKKLFHAIHPGIEVILYTDEGFSKALDWKLRNTDFACFNHGAMILISLPVELDLDYLVGLANNQMYSHDEVLTDPLILENHSYPCEPKTYEWQYFYTKIVKIASWKNKQVPNPLGVDKCLIPISTKLRFIDIKGKQACIGDTIRFSNTEGHVTEHNRFVWDEINQCVCVGSIPFCKLIESGYIQSTTPGRGNFDFEIVR